MKSFLKYINENLSNKKLSLRINKISDNLDNSRLKHTQKELGDLLDKDEVALSILYYQNIITKDEINDIMKDDRNNKKYLDFYRQRRGSGYYAEKYLISNFSFKKPSKSLDPNMSPSQYDLWLDGIKIEVKATTIFEKEKIVSKNEPLEIRAAHSSSNTWNNGVFAKIYPEKSDVIIFMVIFRNEILYYVLPSKELYNLSELKSYLGDSFIITVNNKFLEKIKKYEANENNLVEKVKIAYKKQIKII